MGNGTERPTGTRLSEEERAEIHRIADRYGATNVRLFGSRARGEERIDSDVDLLVWRGPHMSLLDLVGMEQEIEDLLGRAVDLVTDSGLSPYLRDQILAEAVPL